MSTIQELRRELSTLRKSRNPPLSKMSKVKLQEELGHMKGDVQEHKAEPEAMKQVAPLQTIKEKRGGSSKKTVRVDPQPVMVAAKAAPVKVVETAKVETIVKEKADKRSKAKPTIVVEKVADEVKEAAPTTAAKKRAASAYNVFVAERRKKGMDMKEIAAEWRSKK